MNREPLSNFDAFLLRMDTPTNMALITGLMIFDKPVEFERMRATMEHRLLEFDRFRQRIGEDQARLLKHSGLGIRPLFRPEFPPAPHRPARAGRPGMPSKP